jgi:Thioredoxin-related protein
MKKVFIAIFSFLLVVSALSAQTPSDTTDTTKYPEKGALPKPYHPEENAQKKLNELIKLAKASHKNIFIQAGGNWCIWCLRFNYFVHNQPELNKILNKNYFYYHLNYSPENKNEAVFSKYVTKGKQYGYPFFIILSDKGELLCVQESGIFEAGKGYNAEKVKQFLLKWGPTKHKM